MLLNLVLALAGRNLFARTLPPRSGYCALSSIDGDGVGGRIVVRLQDYAPPR